MFIKTQATVNAHHWLDGSKTSHDSYLFLFKEHTKLCLHAPVECDECGATVTSIEEHQTQCPVLNSQTVCPFAIIGCKYEVCFIIRWITVTFYYSAGLESCLGTLSFFSTEAFVLKWRIRKKLIHFVEDAHCRKCVHFHVALHVDS